MATIDNIIQRAEDIRDETTIGANTATRVGSVMVDTAQHVKDIEQSLDITSYTDITSAMSNLPGVFVGSSGGLGSSASYYVLYTAVHEGETYRITVEGAPLSSGARSYVQYNSSDTNDFISANKVGSVGGGLSRQSYVDEVTIESGAQALAVSAMYAGTFSIVVEKVDTQNVGAILQDLQNDVSQNTNDISDIQTKLVDYDDLYSDKEEEVTTYSTLTGQYINANGDIAATGVYNVDYFPVTEGERYRITAVNGAGNARQYAFYNSSTFSQATLISKGDAMSVGSYTDNLTVPAGATYLAVGDYTINGFAKTMTKITKEFIDDRLDNIVTEINSVVNAEMCVELSSDGENLFIAYLEKNETTEFTFWFKKCMANNLFTFYKIGYRTVARTYPDTMGISSGLNIVSINETGSDNIGPIQTGNGGWTGGNHLYEGDGTTKTAETISYDCYADGKLMGVGEKTYCKSVSVEVINTLYDPAIAPNVGDPILSTPLSTESVVYAIKNNTIEVSVNEKISGTTTNTIALYYGMQSMFYQEEKLMTPNGSATTWTASASSFKKSDYPNFNRFLEKSDTYATYQGTFLYPSKLGNHDLIGGTANIFVRSANKSYHHVISNETSIAGKSYTWSGGYTFFHVPLLEISTAFAYRGIYQGKDAVFFNCSSAIDVGIELPISYKFRKLSVIEMSTSVTTENTFTDANGISISATDAGSAIFVLE